MKRVVLGREDGPAPYVHGHGAFVEALDLGFDVDNGSSFSLVGMANTGTFSVVSVLRYCLVGALVLPGCPRSHGRAWRFLNSFAANALSIACVSFSFCSMIISEMELSSILSLSLPRQ